MNHLSTDCKGKGGGGLSDTASHSISISVFLAKTATCNKNLNSVLEIADLYHQSREKWNAEWKAVWKTEKRAGDWRLSPTVFQCPFSWQKLRGATNKYLGTSFKENRGS